MDRDRKSTGLKSLQGKVWEEGYRTGALRGEVYDDVPRALSRWRGEGRRIAIYSSGSVLAQKLLFAHTRSGDLTPFIDAWFSTTTGPKREGASYARIAQALDLPPPAILFVSDVVPELDAARSAGMATALAVRSGEAPPSGHGTIRSLDEIRLDGGGVGAGRPRRREPSA
jgi:enolase-phosphatase E1